MDPLYSRTKVFHFPDRLGAQARGEHIVPVTLRIKPTNRCNHRCWYCCFRVPDLPMSQGMNEKDEIPWDTLKGILDDAKEMGVKAVIFSGGEPLLYGHIMEAIETLAAANIRIGVLTNGSRLEGDIALALARYATFVRVSMDAATASTYAAIRNVGIYEFERVCRNIERFAQVSAGRCELGVNFVVTRENFTEIEDFLLLMSRLGVRHVKVSEAVVGTTFEVNADYVRPFVGKVREAIGRVSRHLQSKNFRVVDRLLDPADTRGGGYNKQYEWCPFSSWLVVIGADSWVYTCQDKAYTETGRLVKITGRSFREAWFSDETRKRLKNIVPSRDCQHHCVAHEKNLLLLDFLTADPDHVAFV